jgi:hypothetical protein
MLNAATSGHLYAGSSVIISSMPAVQGPLKLYVSERYIGEMQGAQLQPSKKFGAWFTDPS